MGYEYAYFVFLETLLHLTTVCHNNVHQTDQLNYRHTSLVPSYTATNLD